MVFLKPIEKLKFADIQQMKFNKISESHILDYKKQLLDDNKLLKQVSAFANAQGGFLIFGVEETGKGGYPKEILGIDESEINKERIEQVILGNIQSRLNVKVHLINHKEKSKRIVVIQIPNSYLKPHMNSRDNKYYKRYGFEALPMTEIEVSDCYRRRFTGYQQVESYLSRLLEHEFGEGEEYIMPQIIGKIIVIPTILRRMIDTSDMEEFNWIDKLDFEPKYPSVFRYSRSASPTPSPNGVNCKLRDKTGGFLGGLEIHRNGCVYSMGYYGQMSEDKMLFMCLDFCIELLHILQFATTLYQKYNYFGDVKIACNLRWLKNSWLRRPTGARVPFARHEDYPCHANKINILREFPTNIVESKYEYIASGIMDEIFNCYSLWKCPFFDGEGNFKESILKE